MRYNEYILDLCESTEVTLYLCTLSSGKMYTYHSGQIFESAVPEWMNNYVKGSQAFLPFEQNGQNFVYCKWGLDNDNTLIFIDTPTLKTQDKLIKYLLCKPAVEEIVKNDNEELIALKTEYDKLRRSYEQHSIITGDLKKEIESLREQNSDQAMRLKKALAENLTLTKNKNAFHTTDNKQSSNSMEQEEYQRNLSYIIKSLNNIITTGNALDVNVEILSSILPVSSSRELERSPDTVKNYIAKLIGMDRAGKLTASNLKKLCEAFKQ